MTYGETAQTAVQDCFTLNADGTISSGICATETAPFICQKTCVYCSVEAKNNADETDVGLQVEAGTSFTYECFVFTLLLRVKQLVLRSPLLQATEDTQDCKCRIELEM